jgi:hypothetical protein
MRLRNELQVLKQHELLLYRVDVALMHAADLGVLVNVTDVNVANRDPSRFRVVLGHEYGCWGDGRGNSSFNGGLGRSCTRSVRLGRALGRPYGSDGGARRVSGRRQLRHGSVDWGRRSWCRKLLLRRYGVQPLSISGFQTAQDIGDGAP